MMLLYKVNKKIFLLTGFLLYNLLVQAQRVLEVKYEADSRGGYVFSCYNRAFCNYILDLGFTTFTNLKSDKPLPFHAEVKPGYNLLFTLSAIDPNQPVQLKYSMGSQKGCMHPVISADFIYLLPISPGKEAQVYEMSPLKANDSASWYVLRLKMKPGDTIYAARKGIVNEVSDQDGSNDAGQSGTGTQNYIEITQTDCSFARYGILKKNSALVKPGDAVRAGQPIGLVGGDSYGRGSDLTFSVFYFQEEAATTSARITHYIIPLIWTKNNGKSKLTHGAVYTSEFPALVLNQESIRSVPKKKTVSAKKK